MRYVIVRAVHRDHLVVVGRLVQAEPGTVVTVEAREAPDLEGLDVNALLDSTRQGERMLLSPEDDDDDEIVYGSAVSHPDRWMENAFMSRESYGDLSPPYEDDDEAWEAARAASTPASA